MNEEELAPKEDLPMVFPFKFKKYYVRKCYSLLFREICSSLEENDYITVTGTPGIGKSVFYMYVYRKLRIKYPDKVFVVATFDKRQLQNAFIFMSGQEKGKRLSSLEFETIADDNPGSFHLYDAAPKVKPDATMTKCKMITFTSPNPSWESSIRKVATHQYFYVDLWTFDELKKAKSMVEELKSIPNEELLNRFRISHFRRGGPVYIMLAQVFRTREKAIGCCNFKSFFPYRCMECHKLGKYVCRRGLDFTPINLLYPGGE